MKKTARRAMLVSLLATIVYQGAVVSRRVETGFELQTLRSAGHPTGVADFPEPPYSRSNAAPYYAAAAQLASKLPPIGQRSLDRDFRLHNPELAESILADGTDALEMLRKAGEESRCQLGSGKDDLLLDYLGMRQLTQLACLDMHASAKRGDLAALVAQGERMALLLERMANCRGLISHQLSLGFAEQFALTVAEIREDYPGRYDGLLADRVHTLATRLDDDLLPTLREERAIGLDHFENQESGRERPVRDAHWTYGALAWPLVNDRLAYLRTFAEIESAVASGAEGDARLPRICAVDASTYPLAHEMVSYLPKTVTRHREVVARLRTL